MGVRTCGSEQLARLVVVTGRAFAWVGDVGHERIRVPGIVHPMVALALFDRRLRRFGRGVHQATSALSSSSSPIIDS